MPKTSEFKSIFSLKSTSLDKSNSFKIYALHKIIKYSEDKTSFRNILFLIKNARNYKFMLFFRTRTSKTCKQDFKMKGLRI